MCFGFNPAAPPYERVIIETVRIGGYALDLDATYKLATKAYVCRGKDGYTCLSKCKVLADPDSGPLLSTVMRNHFLNIQKLLNFQQENKCKVCINNVRVYILFFIVFINNPTRGEQVIKQVTQMQYRYK